MAVDIQRVVLAAVDTALGGDNPEKKSNGLSAAKAVAVGALLVTVSRFVAKPGGRFVKERLRERLRADDEHCENDAYDEAEPEAEQDEAPGAEDDQQREPGAEGDEGPGAEDDQEPEPQAEGDQGSEAEEVENESDTQASKTRPRPYMFDRAGASGSKIRPAARPPLAVKKRSSGLKKRSKPGLF